MPPGTASGGTVVFGSYLQAGPSVSKVDENMEDDLFCSKMTDLERFQGEDKPRSKALCEPFVRRFVPISSIVVWGTVYFPVSLVPPILVGSALVPILNAVRPGPGPLPPTWLLGLALLFVFVYFVGWMPYVLWVKYRRSKRRRLLREGELIPATFVKCVKYLDKEAGKFMDGKDVICLNCYYRFITDGKPRTTTFGEPNRSIVVLYHPSYRFGGVFVDGTLIYVKKWHSDVQPDPLSLWEA